MVGLENILQMEKLRVDENGIFVAKSEYTGETAISKDAWKKLNYFSVETLTKQRELFDKDKLKDHLFYIENTYNFDSNTIYLEIGCGPAHIGEYMMREHGCTFIGIDFDYNVLFTLKEYLEKKEYRNFVLIHADINDMPIKDSSVDYIYGGGVIEHFPDTEHIIRESFRILVNNGVTFNTVPALTFWWLLTFYNTIPNVPFFRGFVEFIHNKILHGSILRKNFGYQLCFSKSYLVKLHKKIGFDEIQSGVFAVNAFEHAISNKLLRSVYFWIQKFPLTASFYYVIGKKKNLKESEYEDNL